MLPILTPSEAAELDRASEDRGISVNDLMEAAGRRVAEAVRTLAGGTYGRRVVVLCGKGNNGGDGLVAARVLDSWGVGVRVLLIPSPDELGGPARRAFERYDRAGGHWAPCTSRARARELPRADVAVDAVVGTGLRGPAEGYVAVAIEALDGAECPVVAVDIPSGVNGETGGVDGPAVHAAVTVTFGALKPGLVFHPGASFAGDVEVADIGFPPDLVRSDCWLVEPEDVEGMLPPRPPETTKRGTGVVLVVGGSRTMTGAPVLTARSAHRAGAGLVTLAVPEGALPVVQEGGLEPIYLPLPQTDDGGASAEAWPALLARLSAVDVVALGPGLGREDSTMDLVRRLVAESPVPVVLDADGLYAFAGRGSLLADRRSELVITPHAGEFGRLAGLTADEVGEDRVGHARKAAAEFRCPVLLKGSRTVVAEPSARVRVNPTGGPFLATAGSGDVLTGVVAAAIARGVPAADALVFAAYVHGMAGQLAGSVHGEGTVASDVIEAVPAAIARVGPPLG
jgi:ADP-dependent NAD(P)H-hydrate dehydratase / NAD(P)H-hydrate epimerase